MIDKKEKIIDYFKSGIKPNNQLKIGVEHEKFIFDLDTNKRANYTKILKMFNSLLINFGSILSIVKFFFASNALAII